MSRVAISIGKLNIYWYSIFVLIGMLLGIFLVLKESKKQKINEEFIINFMFYGLIIGILGARIYYILFNLDYYLSNLTEIFAIWNGGLAIHGGIISTIIFGYFYSKKHKIKLLQLTDICAVALIIAQAIGRWGNFINQEAYGRITTLESLQSLHIPKFIIDGMYISGHYRQPTFLYESILCVIGFIILLLVRKFYKNIKTGQLTATYLIWYGIIRFIIEQFRSDSLMLGNIKVAQLVSIIFITTGIIIIINSIKKKKMYNKKSKEEV